MLTSAVSICNYSLSLLGHKAISTLDDSANQRVRLYKFTYEAAVELVLSKMDWPFARDIKAIDIDPSQDFGDGRVAYVIPPDCAIPLDITPFGRSVPWEQVGGFIATALQEKLYLKYTRKERNAARFSITFKNAVAKLMVAQLAGPLNGASAKEVRSLYEAFEMDFNYNAVIEASIGTDHREFDNDPDNDTFNSSW